MLELFVFLLVLNFDTFLTGLAFGVARIHITWGARLWIAGCSAVFFGFAMWCGGSLTELLPLESLRAPASLLLLVCTLAMVLKYCGQGANSRINDMWQRPSGLDSNADKRLCPQEAVLLGVALALDALIGGLALGMLEGDAALGALLSGMICLGMLAAANDLGLYTMKNMCD